MTSSRRHGRYLGLVPVTDSQGPSAPYKPDTRLQLSNGARHAAAGANCEGVQGSPPPSAPVGATVHRTDGAPRSRGPAPHQPTITIQVLGADGHGPVPCDTGRAQGSRPADLVRRRALCAAVRWPSSKAAARELSVSAPLLRPAGRGEPGQFAALTAREHEVAAGAGPLRAIAVRPQVALPASRALVATAGLIDAHLAHRSPATSRPGRDTLPVAACPRQRRAAPAAQGNLSKLGESGCCAHQPFGISIEEVSTAAGSAWPPTFGRTGPGVVDLADRRQDGGVPDTPSIHERTSSSSSSSSRRGSTGWSSRRCFPLAQVADATRYVQTEQKTGNVVLAVSGGRGP
jgi:hypothetical protein